MREACTSVFSLVVVVGVVFHALAASCDEYEPGPTSSQRSAYEVLTGLDDTQRSNASIDLEIAGAADHAASQRMEHIESLWNEGRHTEALSELTDLEARAFTPAVGIAWKEPVPSHSPKWYPDVAIGGGRTVFERAAIGYDSTSGNIFVLVQWADGWSMNISTDMGESFSETYVWTVHAVVDMTVVGGHAWVGYAGDGAYSGTIRMRRFHAADGAEDQAYGWVVVDDVNPNGVEDLIVESNAPDTNNRIYVVFTDTGFGTIRIWYDDLSGTSFDQTPTGISNAWYGLDFAYNPYSSSPTEGTFWISYIDSTPNVQIYSNTSSVLFFPEVTQPFTGTNRFTKMSAQEGKVYCVYEKDNGSGQNGVGYLNSSDAGAIWRIGDAYAPVPGGASANLPNVTVRSGTVPAVVFTTDEPSTDLAMHTQREAMSTGQWNGPFNFNSHNADLNTPAEIEWLDVACVRSHGLVYGDDSGVPYFDLMTPRCFFSDGFESGNTTQWSVSIP